MSWSCILLLPYNNTGVTVVPTSDIEAYPVSSGIYITIHFCHACRQFFLYEYSW